MVPPLTQHIKIKVCDRRESNAHSPESESGILSIKLRSQKKLPTIYITSFTFFQCYFFIIVVF